MSSLDLEMFLSGFMGAGIEFLEIVAIAYALARSGYAREAFWGTATGFGVILVVAIGLGPQLNIIPIRLLQCLAGVVLVYFGYKWVRKGVKRQATGKRAGWVHDPLRGRSLQISDMSTTFSLA